MTYQQGGQFGLHQTGYCHGSSSSKAIGCRPLLPQGSSSGLAGAEVITLYAETVNGAFAPLTDTSAILTATAGTSTIIAAGSYKFNKPVTAGNAGASLG